MNNLNPETSQRENSCCGGPAAVNEDACCRQDELAKDAGEQGCGCQSQSTKTSKAASCCQ